MIKSPNLVCSGASALLFVSPDARTIDVSSRNAVAGQAQLAENAMRRGSREFLAEIEKSE
jgi:hypothetical protein